MEFYTKMNCVILKSNSEHLTYFCIYQLWQINYLFLCIFKVHLQNQSNSKQYVKGSYMVRYWSTVDGMWCYIYYHLDFNKRCWRETWNHIFQPLKLFPAWLSRISAISSRVTYLTCFTVGTSEFIRAKPEML